MMEVSDDRARTLCPTSWGSRAGGGRGWQEAGSEEIGVERATFWEGTPQD